MARWFTPLVVLVVVSPLLAADATRPAESPVTASVNVLGDAILQQHANEQTNLLYSPLSIHMALSMTSVGARGQTLAAMNKTLGYDRQPADFDPHAAYREFWTLLAPPRNMGPADPDHLGISNLLWTQRGYPLQEPFGESVGADYHGAIVPADFADQPAGAVKAINSEIANRTKQRITGVLADRDVTPLTRLVLVNTVYLKAKWARPFEKQFTIDRPFQLAEGKSVDVPTMRQNHAYALYEDADRQVVELGYRDGQMSMVIVLPRNPEGLLEDQKQLFQLDRWLSKAEYKKVHLSLPKVKINWRTSLKNDLKSMDVAFGEKADFSGISTHEGLMLSDVIHQAGIDIDEAGTEAAAATAVIAVAKNGHSEKPVEVTVDHPFLLVLRHRPSGAILFVGRVVDPRGN